jgi:hypothetical protein
MISLVGVDKNGYVRGERVIRIRAVYCLLSASFTHKTNKG